MSGFLAEAIELAELPAPTFSEQERIAWLVQRLAEAPGARERDEAGNLIWRLGDGRPRLLLLAHVDTVFPADAPLRFERRGDRVVGPGIGDNAIAVVAVVQAVSSVVESGATAPFAVAFTVGEEGLGDLRGARAACARLRPEQAIAVEGHGLDEVLVDGVGSVRLRLRVTGPGGHSWGDRGTPSAVHALLDLGARLVDLGRPAAPVNVGLVSGGQSVNTIAAEAELVVEQRALDEARLRAFERAVARLRVDPPLRLTADVVGRRPAGRLDRSHPLLETVLRARSRLGLSPALGAGSTDANAALALGIPALTLGIARGGRLHTPHEWVEVGSLDLGLRQLEAVVRELVALPLDRPRHGR